MDTQEVAGAQAAAQLRAFDYFLQRLAWGLLDPSRKFPGVLFHVQVRGRKLQTNPSPTLDVYLATLGRDLHCAFDGGFSESFRLPTALRLVEELTLFRRQLLRILHAGRVSRDERRCMVDFPALRQIDVKKRLYALLIATDAVLLRLEFDYEFQRPKRKEGMGGLAYEAKVFLGRGIPNGGNGAAAKFVQALIERVENEAESAPHPPTTVPAEPRENVLPAKPMLPVAVPHDGERMLRYMIRTGYLQAYSLEGYNPNQYVAMAFGNNVFVLDTPCYANRVYILQGSLEECLDAANRHIAQKSRLKQSPVYRNRFEHDERWEERLTAELSRLGVW